MPKRKDEKTEDRCPSCGYCPHCGQSAQRPVPYPVVPIRPWTPYHPWGERPHGPRFYSATSGGNSVSFSSNISERAV